MDLLLRTYTSMLLVATRLGQRVTRDERGQTALEYVGIMLIVAAIVAAIAGSGLIGNVTNWISQAVQNFSTAPS
jgi:Flp pilus assembly pilin Flp